MAEGGSLTVFSAPADEPVRPIDPAAWVSHSVAMTGAYPPFPGSSSLSTITSSSSVTETERESLPLRFPNHSDVRLPPFIPSRLLPGFDDFNLSLHSDMASVAKAMASPESGLEVRDRMWLKITIPNAFLGKTAAETRRERCSAVELSVLNPPDLWAEPKCNCECLFCLRTSKLESPAGESQAGQEKLHVCGLWRENIMDLILSVISGS